MSSTPSVAPLTLELRASRRYAGVLIIIHVLAIAVSLAVPIFKVLRAGLLVLVVASLTFYLTRDALLRRPDSVIRAVLDGAGKWHLCLRDGRELEAQLEPGAFVHPLLIVLNFRVPNSRRRRSLVLWPDSAPADVLRQLRVRLLMSPSVE